MAIDFTMTEEQELLLSSIRELINNEFPEEYFRTHDEEGKYPREFVKALAENGIPGRSGRARRHPGRLRHADARHYGNRQVRRAGLPDD